MRNIPGKSDKMSTAFLHEVYKDCLPRVLYEIGAGKYK